MKLPVMDKSCRPFACRVGKRSKRHESGHIASLFILAPLFFVLALIVTIIVRICMSPVAQFIIERAGLVNHPITLREAFAYTFTFLWSLGWSLPFAWLLIEGPAETVGLENRGGAPHCVWKKDKVIGLRCFTRKVQCIRIAFKALTTLLCLVSGVMIAMIFPSANLTFTAEMLIASMVALIPVSWLVVGGISCFPTLKRLLRVRTVYFPLAQAA